MKKVIIIITMLLAFFMIVRANAIAEIDVKTGIQFHWWESKTKNDGRQTYFPIKINGLYKNFSFEILSGYLVSGYNPNTGEAISLSNPLDTKLNLSYEFTYLSFADCILGLDLNLPTGKNNLADNDLDLILNPDLMYINNFGEGFNINPTLTLAREWDNLTAGIGIGYLLRGEYDYSSQIRDYEPGSIFNIVGEIGYDLSTRLLARAFSNYTYFAKDKFIYKIYNTKSNNEYQEGDFFLFGLGLNYFQINWDADASIQNIFRGKCKFGIYDQALIKEKHNSRGDEWIAGLSFNYTIDDKTAMRSKLEYSLIEENDYPFKSSPYVNSFYIGKQKKISIGAGVSRLISPCFWTEFAVKGFIKKDKEILDNLEPISYKGISIELKLKKDF